MPVQAGHALPLQHVRPRTCSRRSSRRRRARRCSTTSGRGCSSRSASKGYTWEASPQGVTVGGYGLSVRTEDIAKFGQLYLQRGKWDGKQLVPAGVGRRGDRAADVQRQQPGQRLGPGLRLPVLALPPRRYRGDGAFGQYCVVLPEQDAVIAITSGVRDMQAVLDLVWEKLLPAMRSPSTIIDDDSASASLTSLLKGLALGTPSGDASPADNVSGRTYSFPANDRKLESIRLDYTTPDAPATLVATIAGAEHRISCGRGAGNRAASPGAACPRSATPPPPPSPPPPAAPGRPPTPSPPGCASTRPRSC